MSIVDTDLTVKANKEIIPSISAVNNASGCDTVAPYHGERKASIVKKTYNGKRAKIIGKY